MNVEVFAAPRTGAISSRAFLTTSSRVIGFDGVPRTAVDVLAELRSVIQRDLDDRLAARQSALQFIIIKDEIHFCPHAQDCRILHARLVVRRFERRGFVEQHHRDHVLQADIRHLAIVYDGPLRPGNSDRHLLYVVR